MRVINDLDDNPILPDPHTDVRPYRIDSRTVIYIPRQLNNEEAVAFVEKWRSAVKSSHIKSGETW
jgi:hypothetical protein